MALPPRRRRHHRKLSDATELRGSILTSEELRLLNLYREQNAYYIKQGEARGTQKLFKNKPYQVKDIDGKTITFTLKRSVIFEVVSEPEQPATEKLIKCYALYTGKERRLGKGGFGEAKIGQNVDTLEWVAIKKQIVPYSIRGYRTNGEVNYEQEKAATRQANFLTGSVERFLEYDYVWDDKEKQYVRLKEGDNREPPRDVLFYKGYIIQPLQDVPLSVYCEGTKGDPEHLEVIDSFEEKLDISLSALEDLESRFHSKNILHRDIKANNLMYNRADRKAVLIDFGFNVKVEKNQANVSYQINPNDKTYKDRMLIYKDSNFPHTPGYTSPEVIQFKRDENGNIIYDNKTPVVDSKKGEYSFKSDIYAMGVTLFRDLNLLKKPLSSDLSNKDHQKILLRTTMLIASMLDPDPFNRPDAKKVIQELKEIKAQYLEAKKAIKHNYYIIGAGLFIMAAAAPLYFFTPLVLWGAVGVGVSGLFVAAANKLIQWVARAIQEKINNWRAPKVEANDVSEPNVSDPKVDNQAAPKAAKPLVKHATYAPGYEAETPSPNGKNHLSPEERWHPRM